MHCNCKFFKKSSPKNVLPYLRATRPFPRRRRWPTVCRRERRRRRGGRSCRGPLSRWSRKKCWSGGWSGPPWRTSAGRRWPSSGPQSPPLEPRGPVLLFSDVVRTHGSTVIISMLEYPSKHNYTTEDTIMKSHVSNVKLMKALNSVPSAGTDRWCGLSSWWCCGGGRSRPSTRRWCRSTPPLSASGSLPTPSSDSPATCSPPHPKKRS